MAKLVKAGLVSSSWDKGPTKGMVTNSIVELHRAAGEPQAHHDVGRPGEVRRAGHHARTCSARAAPSGTSWPPTAPRCKQGKSPAAAQAYLSPAAEPHGGPAHQRQRRPADLPLGPGRRAPRLRGRRPLRQEPGRGGRHHHAAPDDPDPEPDRRDQDGQLVGQGLRGLPRVAGRPEGLGQAGLPPRPALGGQGVQLPPAQDALHHRLARRLDVGEHEVLRPRRPASSPRTRQSLGVSTASS